VSAKGSRPDLSNGRRESDLVSAAHSRGTAQAGLGNGIIAQLILALEHTL